MAVRLELGEAIAMAPQPYQNFIRINCAGLPRPLHKDDINKALQQEPYSVTLHRHKYSKHKVYSFTQGRMIKDRGNWYLKFPDESALLAFQLRWS